MTTIEHDPDRAGPAARLPAGFWTSTWGDALELLPKLGTYDPVFANAATIAIHVNEGTSPG